MLLYLLLCYSVRYLADLNIITAFTTDQNLLSKVSESHGIAAEA